jgi:stage II sporulation protein AA (anti-sigma F factor antagonist)
VDILCSENGQDLIVKLKGELDHHFTTEFKGKIDEKLNGGQIKNLTFDMEKIDFVDSSAIGFIIGRYKIVKKNNGKLEIINASHKIRRILDMSGVGKIINIK